MKLRPRGVFSCATILPRVSSTTITPDITAAAERAAASYERARRRIAMHAFVILLCLVGLFFAHEFSHALAALALGGRILSLNVLGVQWIPALELRTEFGFGGYTAWLIPFNSVSTRLIVVAGSTGTLLIAMSAALALNLFRPRGLGRTALVALSLYFADSVIHILPVLGKTSNAAPPWVRSFAEAHYALLDLGIRSEIYLTFVFASALLILALLFCNFYFTRHLP